ncbi:hypothetical protein P43SY_000976 [Pythium insidiosum]|uniref:Ankyrin repeat domain-containing protein n=1 Tax=Pythium insidiosum TaxID=114742 RepID=A0AAD5LD72_PYTIN|nr:hypothetical protein P43SY_000976 [Pythium insidiosum]
MSDDALRDAICDGDLELVRRLVDEQGASVNHIDADDGWPVVLWAVKSHRPEILEFLLERGANVHIGDAAGNTALHKAAYLGHGDCVEILLRHGARLSAQNLMRQTARDLAEIFDRKDTSELLATAAQSHPETES